MNVDWLGVTDVSYYVLLWVWNITDGRLVRAGVSVTLTVLV